METTTDSANPYQASYIDEIIQKDQAGEEITEKKIIMEEKGFDCDTHYTGRY